VPGGWCPDATSVRSVNSVRAGRHTGWHLFADVPEMPGNVTVEEVSSSTLLLSADGPPVKPVIDHGGLDITSWLVTYQAETDDGAPLGREATATFYNGRRPRTHVSSFSSRLYTSRGDLFCNL